MAGRRQKKSGGRSYAWRYRGRIVACVFVEVIIICALVIMIGWNRGVKEWFEQFEQPVLKEVDISGINSPNAILMQARGGKILGEINGEAQIYPASMTKIMTVILGIENLSFIDDTKQCIPPFTRLSFPSDTCQHLMQMLIHELEKHSEFYEDACRYYLNLILIEIQRNTNIHYDFPSKEKNNRDCKFVKEYLDSHYTENITLDILSKESKMNKYYLVHSFTKHFGCSPISYLNDKRIEESKNLLETTNHSIAAIASMIGFSSQSYFSQSFKKNTFMTPNEYRRASRQI